MGIINERSYWERDIYLLERNDLIAGGEDGVDNRPHRELANRTVYLNDRISDLDVKFTDDLNALALKIKDNIQVDIDAIHQDIIEVKDEIGTGLRAFIAAGDNELASQIHTLRVANGTASARLSILEAKHNEVFDSEGKIVINVLPDIIQHNRGSYPNEAAFPYTANDGDFAINMETGTMWIWDVSLNKWIDSGNNSAVTTVNGKTGDVVITIDDIDSLRALLNAYGTSINSHNDAIDTNTKNIAANTKNIAANAAEIESLKAGITVTNTNIVTLVDVAMPLGSVVMFSGSFGGTGNRYPIPLGSDTPNTNWVLCDGVKTDGFVVPDLRGRMIIGANDTYEQGSTGGTTTHTHTVAGNIGATTLNVNQIPSHTHMNYYWSGEGHSAHTHFNFGCLTGTGTGTYVGGNGSHTHSLTLNTSSSANNLPPYYALAYIMRIK